MIRAWGGAGGKAEASAFSSANRGSVLGAPSLEAFCEPYVRPGFVPSPSRPPVLPSFPFHYRLNSPWPQPLVLRSLTRGYTPSLRGVLTRVRTFAPPPHQLLYL